MRTEESRNVGIHMTSTPPDPHDLARFVTAQESAHALAEVRAGRKRTHWMWFVFPQIVV